MNSIKISLGSHQFISIFFFGEEQYAGKVNLIAFCLVLQIPMFMEQEEFELQWVASLQQGINEDTDSITPELLMLRQQRECFHLFLVHKVTATKLICVFCTKQSFGIAGGFGNSKLYKDLSSWGLQWVCPLPTLPCREYIYCLTNDTASDLDSKETI